MYFFDRVALLIRRRHFVAQFIKFCIVGGTSALINFTFYYSLTAYGHFWYVYSASIGFCLSAIFNFLSNKLWTFRNRESGTVATRQVVKFAVVMVTGLGLNTLVIYFLTDVIMLDWRFSWLIANGLVMFWSFSFNRLWTFRA